MGWDGIHTESSSVKEILLKELSHGRGEVLALSVVGKVAYVAYKLPDDKVTALVVLTRHDEGYYNFAYKVIDEGMGPYYYTCPAKILDLLSEPENDLAREWRRKNRERAAFTSKLKPGAKVKFATPVPFDTGQYREAVVVKYKNRKIYRAPDGVLFRMSTPLAMQYGATIEA